MHTMRTSLLPDATPAGVIGIGGLLAAALDELDYGIALLDAEAQVLHLNHRASRWLSEGSTLRLHAGQIMAVDAGDAATLARALHDAAAHGLRRLIALGRGDAHCSAALVPVQEGIAALLCGRPRLCEDLSLQCFARAHALSNAEARVLAALGRGQVPVQIAREHGVALTTVRTQIGAIRDKTGADSIRELLCMVAALPPIVGALRH